MSDQADSDTAADTCAKAQRLLTAYFALRSYIANQSTINYPSGMSINQLKTLHLVAHKPGVTQTSVAERLGVTTASISTSVRELEAQGLIERHANPDDARVMLLHLAPLGEQIFGRVFNGFTRTFAELLDTLEPDEQEQLVGLLEKALTAKQISLDIRKLSYADRPHWMKDGAASC